MCWNSRPNSIEFLPLICIISNTSSEHFVRNVRGIGQTILLAILFDDATTLYQERRYRNSRPWEAGVISLLKPLNDQNEFRLSTFN
ncbi:hypothetical protein GJ496_006082 [Pomphorhynchus laevis]|nr:hypothetical protein GJ496_006082 [Pomphorhynchus laevis]